MLDNRPLTPPIPVERVCDECGHIACEHFGEILKSALAFHETMVAQGATINHLQHVIRTRTNPPATTQKPTLPVDRTTAREIEWLDTQVEILKAHFAGRNDGYEADRFVVRLYRRMADMLRHPQDTHRLDWLDGFCLWKINCGDYGDGKGGERRVILHSWHPDGPEFRAAHAITLREAIDSAMTATSTPKEAIREQPHQPTRPTNPPLGKGRPIR